MKEDRRCRGCAYDEEPSSRYPCHKCTDQSHYEKLDGALDGVLSEQAMYIANIVEDLPDVPQMKVRKEREMNYKEELIRFIEYVLEEELPHEKSWVYATKLKERMERDE